MWETGAHIEYRNSVILYFVHPDILAQIETHSKIEF